MCSLWSPVISSGLTGLHWLPWSPLVSLGLTGLPWSPLVSLGLHWSPLVSTGLHWSPLAPLVSAGLRSKDPVIRFLTAAAVATPVVSSALAALSLYWCGGEVLIACVYITSAIPQFQGRVLYETLLYKEVPGHPHLWLLECCAKVERDLVKHLRRYILRAQVCVGRVWV